ncbi:MAG: SelT/SelW/SelH family protein [Planctomycetes bacterium]|nr:SelT/SelW/SelH family protein [Planctomycetota bacterium]
MRDEVGVDPVLVKGSGGVFDVECDGRLLYSKHKTGRFPEPFEVINQIKPAS